MKNQPFSSNTIQRVAWGVLSVALWYEFFRMLYVSMRWYYNHPLMWPIWLLGLVTMEMAIMHDHPWAVKLRQVMDRLCHVVIALYIAASGLLVWMYNVGWDGCLFREQSLVACIKTTTSLWKYFPLTKPSVEMFLLSLRGFGGKNEVVGAAATLLMAVGMVWLLNATSPAKRTSANILPTVVLIASAESGFYGLYTITQNHASWPGFVTFFLIVMISLMLDWWLNRTRSSENME